MVAAVPDGDEGEAEEEAEGAAHLGDEGGERVDQLLLLHEGAVGGRPQLEEEVLAAPGQEQLLTYLNQSTGIDGLILF